MDNEEGYREGVESYRKRIIDELSYMNSCIDGFVDIRNMKFELRYLVHQYRRSLEKINLYLSTIEDLIEKRDDSENDTKNNSSIRRTSVPGREDI